MKIKLIDFGYLNEFFPWRAHENDAGADIYATFDFKIYAGQTEKIPLGFGIELPDGFAGFIFPRSSLSAKGIICQLPPIDSGYKGEIHAIITNTTKEDFEFKKYDRIGQLLIFPIIIPEFTLNLNNDRGTGAFGSSGK